MRTCSLVTAGQALPRAAVKGGSGWAKARGTHPTPHMLGDFGGHLCTVTLDLCRVALRFS